MRYVISDIHGEYDLFFRLLRKIGFSPRDTLYVCGDIIEKGDCSVKLAKLISRMPNVRCIAGNHEHMFLKYYWGIMQSSPRDYGEVLRRLRAYFPNDGDLLDWELVDWFEALPFFIEEDKFVCVHAGLPLGAEGLLPPESATPEQLVYDRNFKDPQLRAQYKKCVFFGHTPTNCFPGCAGKILTYLREGRTGRDISDYYKIHLDLGTPMTGVLGCFCIETCECIYVERD